MHEMMPVKSRATIEVTTHAKQRLYDRFNKLCFGRGDFKEIIQDAMIMGEKDKTFDHGTIRIVFGKIGMVVAVFPNRYLVITVIDISDFNKDENIKPIKRGNRRDKSQKSKLIDLKKKAIKFK